MQKPHSRKFKLHQVSQFAVIAVQMHQNFCWRWLAGMQALQRDTQLTEAPAGRYGH
jgi:hypothetical protein